jgi:transposase
MQTKEHKIWVGIDVGSKSFHAALDFPMLFEKQEETSVSDLPNREFKLTSAGVKSFFNWIYLQQSDFFARYSDDEQDDLPIIFIMEATGICSTKLTKLIYTSAPDSKIIVANPEPIKSFRISLNIKNKTDKSDAQVIARYGRERKPSTKQKMPEEFVQLRELSRTRSFLKDQRTAINNHHDNIDSSLAKRMCSNTLNAINNEIDGLDREIEKIVLNTPEIKHEVDIMTSMPGIGIATAVALLGELGTLKNYPTRQKITAMCGLNPVRKQSGTSVNSTHLSKKGSPVVRRFLYMCSKTAVPSIPVLQDLYDRLLVKGNTRMQARCAVMRKMLLILRGMVIADKKYDKNFKKN